MLKIKQAEFKLIGINLRNGIPNSSSRRWLAVLLLPLFISPLPLLLHCVGGAGCTSAHKAANNSASYQSGAARNCRRQITWTNSQNDANPAHETANDVLLIQCHGDVSLRIARWWWWSRNRLGGLQRLRGAAHADYFSIQFNIRSVRHRMPGPAISVFCISVCLCKLSAVLANKCVL